MPPRKLKPKPREPRYRILQRTPQTPSLQARWKKGSVREVDSTIPSEGNGEVDVENSSGALAHRTKASKTPALEGEPTIKHEESSGGPDELGSAVSKGNAPLKCFPFDSLP